MPLTPGQRLGHYEILDLLGAGGMGEVYRASDLKLPRKVAIKVLKRDRADDPQWLDRFEGEARHLAALNHPQIATLHGLEDSAGIHFLVMELVPGQTLTHRLRNGPLPLARALAICRQVAEAVAFAHDQGVVHRDLKPGNVMVTDQGQVKVVDFGLAVSASASPARLASDATTQSYSLVAAGQPEGTAFYMSPEQARGEPAQKCCDVWAFGCILYEMLTGRRAFDGQTAGSVLAAVGEREPDWSAIPPGTPRRVVGLIRRCLTRDPHGRLRDLNDARLEIEEVLAEPGEPMTSRPPSATWRRFLLPALGLVLMVALIAFGLGMWFWRPAADPPPADTLEAPTGEILIGGLTRAYGPRVSPNGRRLAFIVLHEGRAQVGHMDLDTGKWGVLTHHTNGGGVNSVCWANDSQIYYDRWGNPSGEPRGICGVSPDEERRPPNPEPRVVLGGQNPQLTVRGSLLVTFMNGKGDHEFHECWPNDPERQRRVLAHAVRFNLPGEDSWWPAPVRTLRTKNAAVFCGRLLDGTTNPPRMLHWLDLETGQTRPLCEVRQSLVALAVTPDDRYACLATQEGDGHELRYVALEGGARPRVVMTLMNQVYGLDFDGKQCLYVDQFRQPPEVLRFSPDPSAPQIEPQRVAALADGNALQPVELAGGSVVVPSKVLGRDRLLVVQNTRGAFPLLPDTMETRPPIALLGKDRIVFVAVGSRGNATLRLADLVNGQADNLRTLLEGDAAQNLTTLAGSHDGKMVYYVRDRKVYELPIATLKESKIADGDGVAVHPNDKEVLVQRIEVRQKTSDGRERNEVLVRLFRVPRGGGEEREVAVVSGKGRPTLAPEMIGARAIAADGRRVLVTVQVGTSWFWPAAVLDLDDGKIEPLRVNFEADYYPSNWADDGKVLSIARPAWGDIWRFTPRK